MMDQTGFKKNSPINERHLLSAAFLFVASMLLFQNGVRAEQEGQIVRAGLYQSPPAIYSDKMGKPAGFWPDLLGYIAAQEKWKIEWVDGSWKQSLEMLENNQIDLMPDTILNEDRAKRFAFSNEVTRVSWSSVYGRPGYPIENILDLDAKVIAVLAGSANYQGPGGIKETVEKFGLNTEFLELPNELDVLKAIERGRWAPASLIKIRGRCMKIA